MMPRAALIWLALGGAAGFALFELKYEVQTLEDELAHLNRAIRSDQEEIHVLKAEWSYLNRTERLADLSRRHLDLQPITTTQMLTIEDLPMRGGDTQPERPVLDLKIKTDPPAAPEPALASAGTGQ